MDVISPEITRIGRRFYRKNPLKISTDENAPYREEDDNDYAMDDECEDLDLPIQENNQGFSLKLPVASLFYGYLVGRNGRTRQQLELTTNTQLRIPSHGKVGPVEIYSKTKRGIVSAKNRIDMIVSNARETCDFTHFICFPIRSAELTEKLDEFKAAVAHQCVGDRGLDPSLFQNWNKMHMTVGIAVIANDAELEEARQMIQDWFSKEKPDPVQIELAGLDCMNDDPSEVNVLYIKIAESEAKSRLQEISDDLLQQLTSRGLLRRQTDRVKLHITLLNSTFRQSNSTSTPGEAGRGQRKPRETFDASNMLKRFGDFNFGCVTVDQVHLSQRHATGGDGFYKPSVLVNLNSDS